MYVVGVGDTLSSICAKFRCDPKDIHIHGGGMPTLLGIPLKSVYPGMKLSLPRRTPAPKVASPARTVGGGVFSCHCGICDCSEEERARGACPATAFRGEITISPLAIFCTPSAGNLNMCAATSRLGAAHLRQVVCGAVCAHFHRHPAGKIGALATLSGSGQHGRAPTDLWA